MPKPPNRRPPDRRTENLRGTTAKVWELYQESDGPKAFRAALEDQGIGFALVTKEEAERSHKEASLARAAGNYTPRWKPGEIVLVTTPGLEFPRNGEMVEPSRVHKIDQSLAAKFLKGLDMDRRELGSIEATQQKLDTRAQERKAERDSDRMDRATWIQDWAPERGRKAKVLEPIMQAGKVATQVIEAGIDAAANIATAAFSILDPPTTPAQREQAAEQSRQEREHQAERQLDFTRFTSDTAQAQRHHEEQQAARDRQREMERGRELER